jgi:hypothetical protein
MVSITGVRACAREITQTRAPPPPPPTLTQCAHLKGCTAWGLNRPNARALSAAERSGAERTGGTACGSEPSDIAVPNAFHCSLFST